MQITHKTKPLGVNLECKEFTQAQYEKYQELLIDGGSTAKSGAAGNAIIIRAALTAGFLTGIEADQVGALLPWKVTHISAKILEFVKEQVQVPPE